MNTKPYLLVWTALMALLLTTGCALQRDVYMLEERLLTLEKRNRDLNKQIDSIDQERQGLESNLEQMGQRKLSGEKQLRGQYASINANVDTLREEVATLSGRLEETEHYIQMQQNAAGSLEDQVRQKQNLMAEDLAKTKRRLDQVEQYLNMEKGAAKAKAQKTAAPKPAAANAAGVYAAAKKSFDAGNLDQARNGFSALLKNFPKSDQADNAQFWLGEIYFREKWYEKAILEYQKVIENYPKGNKVAAALLKQGLAFLKIGDKANSRLILQDLLDKFPQTNEGRIAAQKIKEL